MTKATENFIIAELKAYHWTVATLEAQRMELIEAGPGPSDGMPHGTQTSDPTASKAIQLLTSKVMLCAERRVAAIDRVLGRHRDDETLMALVDLSFLSRTHTPTGVCLELHISRRSYYRRRRAFLAEIADELGLD